MCVTHHTRTHNTRSAHTMCPEHTHHMHKCIVSHPGAPTPIPSPLGVQKTGSLKRMWAGVGARHLPSLTQPLRWSMFISGESKQKRQESCPFEFLVLNLLFVLSFIFFFFLNLFGKTPIITHQVPRSKFFSDSVQKTSKVLPSPFVSRMVQESPRERVPGPLLSMGPPHPHTVISALSSLQRSHPKTTSVPFTLAGDAGDVSGSEDDHGLSSWSTAVPWESLRDKLIQLMGHFKLFL